MEKVTLNASDYSSSQTNTTMPSTTYYDHFNPGTPFDRAMDALLITAVALSFYVLVSLLYYEWSFRRSDKGASRKSRIGEWLRILCILSALFCLLRSVNDIAYYKAQMMSDVPCTVLKNMGASWLIEVDTTVYLFLWLRHRALYQNPSLRLPVNTLIKIVSWFAVTLIALLCVSMNVIILGWRRYIYNPTKAKCSSVNKLAGEINGKLFVAGSTTLHIILVGLYVYPLIRHVMNTRLSQQKQQASTQSGGPVGKPPQSSKGQSGLMRVVVKCVVLSLLCVLTDGLTILLTSYVIDATKARHFSYNINVIFNTVAIVLSLKDWRDMLCPCRAVFVKGEQRDGSPIASTETSNFKMVNRCDVVT